MYTYTLQVQYSKIIYTVFYGKCRFFQDVLDPLDLFLAYCTSSRTSFPCKIRLTNQRELATPSKMEENQVG